MEDTVESSARKGSGGLGVLSILLVPTIGVVSGGVFCAVTPLQIFEEIDRHRENTDWQVSGCSFIACHWCTLYRSTALRCQLPIVF